MEEKKDNFGKKLGLALVLVLSIIIVGAGATYAYFVATIVQSDTTSTISIKGGSITVAYTSENTITGTNVIPGWAATKSFAVTSTYNTNGLGGGVNYNIIMKVTTNTFTETDTYLTYTLESCDSTYTTCSAITNKSNVSMKGYTTTGSPYTLYTSEKSTVASHTEYYNLTVTFPNNTATTQAQAKNFSAVLYVTSDSQITAASTTTKAS